MYEHQPDEALAMVYNRRTFHARPRNYYHVFQETAQFTIGDVAYSEGHHDHLNQWIYQRLFWDPHQSVEDVVGEYARTFFGPKAAPYMTQAIFTLEENLQTPIAQNTGIDQMIRLTELAGHSMPADFKSRNWLWREYMQKAYLDKYIQSDVWRQQVDYKYRVRALERALESDEVQKSTQELTKMRIDALEGKTERLKAEADRLGRESNELYGVRNEGLFNLDQDYCGLGWLNREIERAANAESEQASRAIVDRIVNYENPGEGGFYDNAGDPAKSPHLVYGWPFGESGFSSANRPSQKKMAFTTDEDRGVAFRYKDLDRNAQYRVRLSLVRPSYLPRYAKFQTQTSESIYADETPIAENLSLPESVAGILEFEIPKSETADGELLLWAKKQPGIGEGLESDKTIWRNTGGWGTLVSEVWLIKK